MPTRIRIHHGIIVAVRKEIQSCEVLGIQVGDMVLGKESAGFGVVVSCLEVVQPRLGVVVVASVADGVDVADVGRG